MSLVPSIASPADRRGETSGLGALALCLWVLLFGSACPIDLPGEVPFPPEGGHERFIGKQTHENCAGIMAWPDPSDNSEVFDFEVRTCNVATQWVDGDHLSPLEFVGCGGPFVERLLSRSACRDALNRRLDDLYAPYVQAHPGADWWWHHDGVNYINSGLCPSHAQDSKLCNILLASTGCEDFIDHEWGGAGHRVFSSRTPNCHVHSEQGRATTTGHVSPVAIFDRSSAWYGHIKSSSSSAVIQVNGQELWLPVFGSVSVAGECIGSVCSLRVDGISLTIPDFEVETSVGVARIRDLSLMNSGPWEMLTQSDGFWSFNTSGTAIAVADADIRFQSVESLVALYPEPADLPFNGVFVNYTACLPSEAPNCAAPSPAHMTVQGPWFVEVPGVGDWLNLTLTLEIPFDGGASPVPRVTVWWLSRDDVSTEQPDYGWRWDASGTDWGTASSGTFEWKTRTGSLLGSGSSLVAVEVPATDTDGGDPYPLSISACSSAGSCAEYPILFAPDDDCDLAPLSCSRGCGDSLLVLGEECDDGNLADGDGCSASCLVEVPEPGSSLMLVAGVTLLWVLAKRRSRVIS